MTLLNTNYKPLRLLVVALLVFSCLDHTQALFEPIEKLSKLSNNEWNVLTDIILQNYKSKFQTYLQGSEEQDKAAMNDDEEGGLYYQIKRFGQVVFKPQSYRDKRLKWYKSLSAEASEEEQAFNERMWE